MEILQEMGDIVMSVFTTDSISLIIMLLVVVAAGMMLGQIGRLIQVTVGALAIYGLLRLGYSLSQGAEPTTLPATAWGGLKMMTVGELVVYFIAFAIVISIVHIIRNAVASRGH
ncbi:MAG: hypothetical protein ACKVRO_17440 [Micropepsaceae bacterium]